MLHLIAAGVLALTPVTATTVPRLPEPTGPSPVGMTSLYLKDTSRPDPWVAGSTARELMVSLWYPAKAKGHRRVRYMTPKESELFLRSAGITGVPYDAMSRTRTNAYSDVEPAGRGRGLPLVVLSPGFTDPRSSLTALAEDLASRGYMVASIDHTYENHAMTFPDGRVVTCKACEVKKDEAFGPKLAAGRAADVSFVVDRLTAAKPAWKGARLIDPARIAMAGQSAGGAATVAALVKDRRIRAGIDMDGTTFAPIPAKGLAKPFLFLGTEEMHSPGGKDVSWDRDWKLMTGWKRWLTAKGAEHASFTDVSFLADELGIRHGATLSGSDSIKVTRAYTGAFFDLHLRGLKQPLLDKPSPRYPAVTIAKQAAPAG
ncbi:alpha/beta hydrolase [Nonomuraea sp. NBC_01738]|uniref:alpha/beta hydrolase family protein n=1 Tax=Nonomuraea sp. NBC_01738 TaxID=2976003 RepID=UPI002E13E674|nr:alpha/beta hydrolase [Nonomuraea sp. NBC_01738]